MSLVEIERRGRSGKLLVIRIFLEAVLGALGIFLLAAVAAPPAQQLRPGRRRPGVDRMPRAAVPAGRRHRQEAQGLQERIMTDTAARAPWSRRGGGGAGMFGRRIVWVLGAAALIVLILATATGCTRQVHPGNVGVMVNNIGSDAGVSPQARGVGIYFVGFGQQIYEYPVYTRTYTWTQSSTEQSAANEEFQFQDKNGLALSADVAVAFSVDSARAPKLFQKYRTSMEGVISGPLRNAIRDALVTRAAQMSVEEIYGPRKAELIRQAESDVRAYMSPAGLIIERLYWAGNVRLPDTVLAQINMKIANEQAALAAQAKVAQAQAEADQQIALARGEAESIKIRGEALRQNPEVARLQAINKWNGVLPSVVGGGQPIPFIEAGK
jgi:regulator of protease activity HflC (stomatin/prohibitin superfamily)